MKVWLLERINIDGYGADYDMLSGAVVRASTPRRARKLVAELAGREGEECWMDPKQSKCELLKEDGPEEIILADYHEA